MAGADEEDSETSAGFGAESPRPQNSGCCPDGRPPGTCLPETEEKKNLFRRSLIY